MLKKVLCSLDDNLTDFADMLIGRGKGGQDPETLFKYAVQTNDIKMWKIVGKSSKKLDKDSYGFFFSAEGSCYEI